ncbi:MAG: hypothetical protein ABXS92_08600 [Sulfurimonas sp.]
MIFINPLFSSHLKLARRKGLDGNAHIYFWGRKNFPEVEAFAAEHKIPIYRVEDGFIRSVALGSDLTQPYSQVIDKRGIYFDPTQPSDLEEILCSYDFANDPQLLERAKRLKAQIIRNKISKYNADSDRSVDFSSQWKTVALVAGQVEDDASIQYGANGMTNLELLQTVKKHYPDRYIIFKPHPDVLSGNRVGDIPEKEALQYCNEVITDIGMGSMLAAVDELHTMTSLTGFEALVYGKKVYTYGLPFYAGWGLTTDKESCERRGRKLDVDALIAAVYLLYPRYISPRTKEYCEAEEVIRELKAQKEALEHSWFLRAKFKTYNTLSRVSQKLLSYLK